MNNHDWLNKPVSFLDDFIKKESSAGLLLIFVTVLALLLQNSGLSRIYNAFLHTPVEIRFGALYIDKPLFLILPEAYITGILQYPEEYHIIRQFLK